MTDSDLHLPTATAVMTDDTLLPIDLPSVCRKKITVDFIDGNQADNLRFHYASSTSSGAIRPSCSRKAKEGHRERHVPGG
jgi:hypothetical protein